MTTHTARVMAFELLRSSSAGPATKRSPWQYLTLLNTRRPRGAWQHRHRMSSMARSTPSREYSTTTKKVPTEPRPSSSILLISPTNEILLLHRVQNSTSFPSAHVFPGGNVSLEQDGAVSAAHDASRHVDSLAYRRAAVRECFEESGVLLALSEAGGGRTLLRVGELERERARREVYAGKLRFEEWVRERGGFVDTDGLIPFTRWITPANIPKRYTTQMYIYFLPLNEVSSPSTSGSRPAHTLPQSREEILPTPTPDGGIEHTAAVFAPLNTWLEQARRNEIILFPPQFYLLHLLAPYFQPSPSSNPLSRTGLQRQRDEALEFLKGDGDGKGVLWRDKVISPTVLFLRKRDGRTVLGLDKPGLELKGSGRAGDSARVVLVRMGREGPRDLEVRVRKDLLDEERMTNNDTKL